MRYDVDLGPYGLSVREVLRNAAVARLYEDGVTFDGALIASSGALTTNSGGKTGRSPRDKRIVEHPASAADVWWGNVNIKLPESSFVALREQAIAFLNTRERLYVVDGFAGWDPKRRLKIRVLCARPYHALFMHTMLIRPTREELSLFGTPDYVIFNAGEAPADPNTSGLTSSTSVSVSFERGEFVVLGTQYAGEMKKGVFTLMHYLMPKQDVLSMHCSANEGAAGDVSLFFGLSGTGKTTLSADTSRQLIGDDEHCWSDDGIFNIEGGCYAKCIHLSREKEPEIFEAIRFGTVLENTVIDPVRRVVRYDDASLTENTRAAYPIEFIPNAKIPCVAGHPSNIIFLTCDAFGVLPPVSRLTPEQAMYHFISGYTAKVAGTEVGVVEPQATFSACFGAAFLVWHPTKYAEMLASRLRTHQAQAWLVNTGWLGGAFGTGERIDLAHTRAIIDAIHSGDLRGAPTGEDPVFGLAIPQQVSGVPDEILRPENSWADAAAYRKTAEKLATLFHQNFRQYAAAASTATRLAGPRPTIAARV
ncbi:MAG: phosphoenolpyruvate carboxykinase (ATP) [Planctomycetia bacterium]|nr:phosphoenolpyruvate carboxykinase (ATP) [Planctomycetia bacterium]